MLDRDLLDAIFRQRACPPSLQLGRRGLRELAAARGALARLEAALVTRARDDGATWAEIAADVGEPVSTVRERHRARHPPRPRFAEPDPG